MAGKADVQGSEARKCDNCPYVLIVDADADARGTVAEFARAEGFLVVEAAAADVALRILNVGGISLLISEMQLDAPTDGLELIAESHRLWPDLSMIAVSTDLAPFPGTLPQGTSFVGKPYNSRRLSRLLKQKQ